MKIKNVAFYKFFKPAFELQATRDAVQARMKELAIKGTILMGDEGINGSLSGMIESMDAFLVFLWETIGINPPLKISFSDEIPFKRSLVKIKKFIVAPPGATVIDPTRRFQAPYISPEEFHQWVKDNKKMVVLDTRNDYEYQAGRFVNAQHLGTKHFKDFEGNLNQAPSEWQSTPVVTFCTGGIRCEKAAPLMLKKGFKEVYQLDGGILNYFKKIGRGYFEGECFVFDERSGVAP